MKVNKKGFTLVELLGVIIILTLIISIVIPKVIGGIKSKQKDANSLNDDIVLNAVKLYVSENKKDYPDIDGNIYCIEANKWNEISSKYLSKSVNYDNSVIFKTVEVDYSYVKGYTFKFNGSCVSNYLGN